MRLDPVATLRFGAVAAWAGLFDYLLLSGESLRFVGPRTQWVVPFGAITLTLAALGLLLTLRPEGAGRRPTVADLAGLVVLVAPVLALAMVPSPSLGAFAAERKESPKAAVTVPSLPPDDGRELFKLAVAANLPDQAKEIGIRVGKPMELTGVVSDRETGDAAFKLTRFIVNCCAADAVAYTVTAALRTGTDTPPPDRWVRLHGSVARGETSRPGFVVAVDAWEPIPEPDDLAGY